MKENKFLEFLQDKIEREYRSLEVAATSPNSYGAGYACGALEAYQNVLDFINGVGASNE